MMCCSTKKSGKNLHWGNRLKKRQYQLGQKQIHPPKIICNQRKPADLRSSVPVMRAGIDNASAKRLTKGHFDIDETIDLYGKTEALA